MLNEKTKMTNLTESNNRKEIKKTAERKQKKPRRDMKYYLKEENFGKKLKGSESKLKRYAKDGEGSTKYRRK